MQTSPEFQAYAHDFDQWTTLASAEPVSPIRAMPGDLTREFSGADGRKIRIVVQIPHAAPKAGTVTVGPVAAGADARPAFDAALEQVRTLGAGRLIIPHGDYTFKSVGSVAQFSVVGVKDLEIVGNDSTLNFTLNKIGLFVTESQRVRVSNLTLRTTLHTRSVAKVADVNGTPTLIVDPEYVISTSDKIGSLFEQEPATGRRLNGGQRRYYPTGAPTFVGQNSYVSRTIGSNLVGKSFTVFHYFYGGPMVRVGDYNRHTSDIILDGVNVQSGPGMGIIGIGIKRGLALVNSSVWPSQGSLGSTLYDGINISGTGGDTMLINDRSSGEGDDHVNLGSPVAAVRMIDGAGTTFQMGLGSTLTAVGDKLAFFDTSGKFLGSANVTFFKNLGSNMTSITIDHQVAGVVVQSRVRNANLAGQRWIISRGDFENGGRVLAQVPNGAIQGSNIRDSGGLAALTSIGSFNEGIGAINIVVEGNTIENTHGMDPTSYTLNVFPWAAISLYALDSRNHVSAILPQNRNVKISNNIIRNSDQGCISIGAADSVVVSDNTCEEVDKTAPRLSKYNFLGNAFNIDLVAK